MRLAVKTARGYVSLQPDGRIEFRTAPSRASDSYEAFELENLDVTTKTNENGTGDEELRAILLGCDPHLVELELVACLCAKIQPAGSVEKAFEVIKRVAWALRAHNCGLLLKPGGENVVTWHGKSFSAGRVCFADGHVFKLLTDVPTTNGPQWADNGFVDAANYEPAIDPRT
jgi:hypothetical protein